VQLIAPRGDDPEAGFSRLARILGFSPA
jgi:hypothetical protein